MVHGAGRADGLITGLAASLFAVSVIMTSLALNAPIWRTGDSPREAGAIKSAIACNVWLASILYAWAASALFGIYSLSDLSWRHAWQYGLAAALIAAGLMLYAWRLDGNPRAGLPPLFLTALHGLAAGSGLVYLAASGKLATLRSDWAANQVFLAGGLAVVALCIVTAITQVRDSRPP